MGLFCSSQLRLEFFLVNFVWSFGTFTKLLTSTEFVLCLFVLSVGVDNAMTITYFNLSGCGSNWCCAQFVVS